MNLRNLAPSRRRSFFGWLMIAAMILASLAGVSYAGAASKPSGKSAAYAREQASGFAHVAKGQGGGTGHGKAIGRSRAIRYSKPPQHKQTGHEAPNADDAPHQTANAPAETAKPTVPATGAGARHHTATASAPTASGGTSATSTSAFTYFRSTSTTGIAYTTLTPDEPSTSNDGPYVLYTGNAYAATSSDSGHTFSYLDPFNLGGAPTLSNGGFCCDQVVVHTPAISGYDETVWLRQYWPNSSTNDDVIRLSVARNQADLASSTFDYYDFSAQSFGFPEGDWLDYGHMAANNGYVFLTINVFTPSGNIVTSLVVRFDDSSFASGGYSDNYYWNAQDFTWTPVDDSHDSWGYWGATAINNSSLIRVYNWPAGQDYTHISWNDFSVPFNSEWKNGNCPPSSSTTPSTDNWCAFDDSRVKAGGEVGSGRVWFMWDAKEGGGFAFPYIQYASFDVSSGPATAVSTSGQIWNGSYAWAYPGLGVNANGDLGVSAQIGGGSWGDPGSQFLINDGVSGGNWEAHDLADGAASDNRWGDYLTARAAQSPSGTGNTWLATGFTLDSNGAYQPGFYWVGRESSDPFAPSMGSLAKINYGEGQARTGSFGSFYGPSNCACDYYGINAYGDGTSDYSNVVAGSGLGMFNLTDTHTYSEEGATSRTLYADDYFGSGATSTGTDNVLDGALTLRNRTVYAPAGGTYTGIVSMLYDRDIYGTASDYSATINWGDGTTSAGTVSASGTAFKIVGTHAYSTVGTYTVSVSASDAGGKSTSATSSAQVGNAPHITALSPTGGPVAGGTTVVITGSHFTGATKVYFGPNLATYTINSDGQITAHAPAHAAGTVWVKVVNIYGASNIGYYKYS